MTQNVQISYKTFNTVENMLECIHECIRNIRTPLNLSFLACKFYMKSMAGVFRGCANILSIEFIDCSFPNLIDTSYMFSGCTSLTTIYFDGVKSQWTSLIKGANWDGGREDIQIIWNASDEDWGLGGVPLH